VLFLDELPEFQPQVLDSLRQPLETGEVAIARANHRISYPARFMLVAAMNPCRCGRANDPGYSCKRGANIRCAGEYQGRLSGPLLDRIDVVILPRVNPDGATWGSRVSSDGHDINRDHLLLRTPEARAVAALARRFEPLAVIDAHEHTVVGRYLEKFGAIQRNDLLFQQATTANLENELTETVESAFLAPLRARLDREHISHEWYYTNPTTPGDVQLSMGGVQPDTARNVQGLRNELSLTIATRGAGLGRQHLKRRVHAQVIAMGSVLASVAQRGGDLLKLRSYVDAEVASQSCQGEVVLEAAPTATEYAVQMLDPATAEPQRVTVSWDSALVLGNLRSRPRPCGYWLDADQTEAVSRLRAMGVRVEQVLAKGVVQGDGYVEGAAPRRLETVSSLLDMLPGSYYVPLAQPLANLAVAALEPDTSFSFVAGGVVSSPRKVARVMALPGTRLNAMP